MSAANQEGKALNMQSRNATRALAAVAAAILTLHQVKSAAEEPLILTPDNTIILNRSMYAHQQLQYYLLKAYVSDEVGEGYRAFSRQKVDRSSGPHFPVLDGRRVKDLPAGKNILAVGHTRFLSEEDRARLEETVGSVLLKRQGNVIIIAGSSHRGDGWNGTFRAANLFLDKCAGVRLYAPDDLWMSRPKEKQIVIKKLDFFQKPFFRRAGLNPMGLQRNTAWSRVSGAVSRGEQLRAGHYLIMPLLPVAKTAKEHPEVFEMRGGQRRVPAEGSRSWQPCLSAEALPELTMAYIRDRKKKNPRLTYVSLGMQDCAFDCECEPCQESVKRYGSYSNLYYTYLNKVARTCQAELPDFLITVYIYANARTAPIGMRIEPNIAVTTVTKSYRWVDPAWLEYEKARVKSFSDLGAKWNLHDWFFSGVCPSEYTRTYANFLQWGAQNGLIGAVTEWSPGENWYLDGAKYWIHQRLQSNPYEDVDALWKQYCDDMYDAASEVMYRLFSHFADVYRYYPEKLGLRTCFFAVDPGMYTLEDLKYERSLLSEAASLTKGDPLVQKRLAKVMHYFRGHALFVEACSRPRRLDRQSEGRGLNRELLAYYLNERENKIGQAIQFYRKERTVPPDSNEANQRQAALSSYVGAYASGKGCIINAIKAQALADVDAGAMTEKRVAELTRRMKAVLDQNLPAKYVKERREELEKLLEKNLWLPTCETMPTIDGNLSDPIWQEAAVLDGFSERDVLFGSKHKTSGRVLRVADHLIVGLTCHQEGPIFVKTRPGVAEGSMVWRESGAEIFFGKVGDEESPYVQYIITAQGAIRACTGAKGLYEGVKHAAVLDRDRGRYTIECALPLAAEGRYDFRREKALSFNIMRNVFLADSFQAEVIIGWAPIFVSAHRYDSRGFLFMEERQ